MSSDNITDDMLNNTTKLDVGDIICHVENYSNGYRRKNYGFVIAEKHIHAGRRMLKIQWFNDSRDSWHPCPLSDPPWRLKNFFVVSKAGKNIIKNKEIVKKDDH